MKKGILTIALLGAAAYFLLNKNTSAAAAETGTSGGNIAGAVTAQLTNRAMADNGNAVAIPDTASASPPNKNSIIAAVQGAVAGGNVDASLLSNNVYAKSVVSAVQSGVINSTGGWDSTKGNLPLSAMTLQQKSAAALPYFANGKWYNK